MFETIMSSVSLSQHCRTPPLLSSGLRSPWNLFKTWFPESMRESQSWKDLSLLPSFNMQGLRPAQTDNLLSPNIFFSFMNKIETPWAALKCELICRAIAFQLSWKRTPFCVVLQMPKLRVAGPQCKAPAQGHRIHKQALNILCWIPKQTQGSLKLYMYMFLKWGNEDQGNF